MEKVLDVAATGTAVLIVGDLGDADAVGSSLEALKREGLKALGEDISLAIGPRKVVEALVAHDEDRARQLVLSHLSRIVTDRDALVRVIRAPWERIYSVSGLSLDNVDFKGLERELHHHPSHLPRPAGVRGTLVVDDSPYLREHPLSFLEAIGRRTQRSEWRLELQAKTLIRPVVAVAKMTDDALWGALDARRASSSGRELPPAMLILETVTPQDRLKARAGAVTLLEGTLKDLAASLPPGDMKIQQGRRLLARGRKAEQDGTGVVLVSTLTRDVAPQEGWDFLRGFDPTWADVVLKRPLRLLLVNRVRAECRLDAEARNTVVPEARAGAGKTTTLMTLARDLVAKGLIVAWIDRSASHKMSELVDEILEIEPDCVFVDDADIFGDAAPTLLRRLNGGGRRLVVASVRTTRSQVLGALPPDSVVREKHLTDDEIEGLHNLLEAAGLLGSLQGVHPLATRLEQLKQVCQRDLLAALIEIVTGERFEDRVRTEFRQLYVNEQKLYGMLAIYLSHIQETRSMPQEQLLQCCAEEMSLHEAASALDSLVQKRLVLEHSGNVQVRHRSIARALVNGLSLESQAASLGDLLSFFAAQAHGINDSSDPLRRTMISLLSHSLYIKLNLPAMHVQRVYERVQDLLADDFHFWLQRGAFETESGDLDLARTYLRAAQACPGGGSDYKVATEVGIMALRRSVATPSDTAAQDEAVAAIKRLAEVAKRQGANSPHTFKVLARDAARFVCDSSGLSATDKQELKELIDGVVAVGLRVCQDNQVAMEALKAYGKREGIEMASRGTAYPMPTIPKPGPRGSARNR